MSNSKRIDVGWARSKHISGKLPAKPPPRTTPTKAPRTRWPGGALYAVTALQLITEPRNTCPSTVHVVASVRCIVESEIRFHVAKTRFMGFTADVVGRDGGAAAAAESPVVARIRAMLNRALHPTTPRAEAESAMRLATREMRAHNLTQAAIMMATDTTPEALRPGRWRTRLTENGRVMLIHQWLVYLYHAVNKGFEVDSYQVRRAAATDVVFYGIDGSAEAAARAFVRYFHHMDALALRYRASGRSDDATASNDDDDDDYVTPRVTARMCVKYREGIASGLDAAFAVEREAERVRVADTEIRAEKERRARAHAAEREAARRRHAEQVTAHTLDLLARGEDPRAPLVIDVDDDDDELPDPNFDLPAAEHEIAVCKALAVHTNSVMRHALGTVKVRHKRGRRHVASSEAELAAYLDGVRDAKKIRLR